MTAVLKRVWSYGRLVLLLSATLLGTVTAVVSSFLGGLSLAAVLISLVSFAVIMIGVSAGYHRYLTHGSYQFTAVGRWLAKPFLLIAGCLSWQGPPLWWATVHWTHHKHADSPGDPHSPHGPARGWLGKLRQVLWAYVLWIPRAYAQNISDFCRRRQPECFERLLSNPFAYLAVGPVLGCAAAFVIGYWTGVGGWLGTAWYLTAVFAALNFTWGVNTVTHLVGSRPFATADRSTNLLLLAPLTAGEAFHNNHHAFQKSPRFGHRWWEMSVDFGWWTIFTMRCLGLVRLGHIPSREERCRKLRAVRLEAGTVHPTDEHR